MTINLIANVIYYKNKLVIGYRDSNELIVRLKDDMVIWNLSIVVYL